MDETNVAIDAYADLTATTCRGCGKRKGSGKSFCFKCYSRLTAALKRKLYDPNGYSETYLVALAKLSGSRVF